MGPLEQSLQPGGGYCPAPLGAWGLDLESSAGGWWGGCPDTGGLISLVDKGGSFRACGIV